jgi:rhodanese-related sulfurtransferase
MTAEQLAARITAGKAPVILDVRSRREFEAGHIPGAVHVPFWHVAAHAHDIPARLDQMLVVYCGHGPRARFAASTLRRMGFQHVTLLEEHWAGWLRAGQAQSRA